MIWTIAKRELSTRGRSRGFIVITVILFVAVIAAGVAASIVTGGDDSARDVTIGLTSDAQPFSTALGVETEDLNPTIVDVADNTEELLSNGDVDVVFDGESLIWDGFPDDELGGHISAVVEQAAFAERATGLGLGPAELGQLFEPVGLGEVRLDGGDDERGLRIAAAAAAGLATFLLLQTWGSFMMMGVIEEKSSKVVEVLLSQVRPPTLLAGKVLGLGILAILQMVIFAAGILIALLLVQDIEIPSGVWTTVPLLVVTFMLGFAFYSALFAAVGSTVSRQEDAVSAQLPAMIPLFAGYFIAFASINNPESIGLTIASFVPVTSPIVLPFRTALTDVPAWQTILALVILAVSAYLVLQLAGQIYRYTLLRSGSRVKLKDAWANRKTAEL